MPRASSRAMRSASLATMGATIAERAEGSTRRAWAYGLHMPEPASLSALAFGQLARHARKGAQRSAGGVTDERRCNAAPGRGKAAAAPQHPCRCPQGMLATLCDDGTDRARL